MPICFDCSSASTLSPPQSFSLGVLVQKRRPSNRYLDIEGSGKAPRSAGKGSGKASRSSHTPLRGPQVRPCPPLSVLAHPQLCHWPWCLCLRCLPWSELSSHERFVCPLLQPACNAPLQC